MIAAEDTLGKLAIVEVGPLPLSRFASLLSPEESAVLRAATHAARTRVSGRTIWNVSSTARGGGVAEMLESLLAYARGGSIDAWWGEDERRDYEATLAPPLTAGLLRTAQSTPGPSTNDRRLPPNRDHEQETVMEQIGSHRSPRVEHARVSDAMNKGIVTCSRDAGLREMGRLMASRHIHSLVVSFGDPERWALVSDVDLAQSAIGRPDATAEDLAVPATGISSEATLSRAIEVMRDQGTSHLIVTDTENGRPTGMISALDIAGIVAWGEG
jgi:CBS domain-containing protein